jgi:hypothetical protein
VPLYSAERVRTETALQGQLDRPELVGRGGLEPPTSRLSGVRSNHLSYRPSWWSVQSGGGAEVLRKWWSVSVEPDPLLAKQVLSQLS